MAKTASQRLREEFRLIEAAGAPAAAVQRNGHDEQRRGQVGNGEDARGEQCSETPREGLNAAVFEEMKQRAELVLIKAVGYSEREGRFREPADAAQDGKLAGLVGGLEAEVFSAAGTERAGLRAEVAPAGGADGNGGEFSKRSAAEAARRWKQDSRDGIECADGGTSEDANYCAPCRCFGWRMLHQRRMLHAAEDSPRAASRTESARLPYG